ncbi:MAG: hypothetical protein GDA46_01505 [Bdellovibrionales bacterium]|nr:hypothetical protein [Bdellovibrionales bacterium]
MKKLLLILVTGFFINCTYAFFEEEDIPCKKLPESFEKYNDDRKLVENTLVKALRDTSLFLKNLNKKSPNEISSFTRDLAEALAVREDYVDEFSTRQINFSFSLSECVKKMSPSK